MAHPSDPNALRPLLDFGPLGSQPGSLPSGAGGPSQPVSLRTTADAPSSGPALHHEPAVRSSRCPRFDSRWVNDKNLGQVFGGKYIIDRVLGEGGMGIVYLSRHKAIGKRFAIKLLHGDAAKDPEVVERFKVEAQAASAIGNEHIIDITDFAELTDGSTYFAMEFLDGRALSKLFD